MHLYIATWAVFRAFFAAVTKFHFKRVLAAFIERLFYGVNLAEAPAGTAVET
jgi:hypothetical protein